MYVCSPLEQLEVHEDTLTLGNKTTKRTDHNTTTYHSVRPGGHLHHLGSPRVGG